MQPIIDANSSVDQDAALKQILQENQVVAVVGLSPKADRPSHRIAVYLLDQGYQVVPINPAHRTVLNQTAYPQLSDIPFTVDLVDVFRKPEYVPDIVQQAIDKKARVLWLQDGVIHHEAALAAASAGMQVVMDRCIFRDHSHFVRSTPLGRILSDFRIQQGRSLDEIAQKLGISPGELEELENSIDSKISPDMIKRLSSAIGQKKAN